MGNRAAVKEGKRKAMATTEVAPSTCQHHWIIDTPRGALSSGRCKRCGEQREFRNSANDYIWDDDSTSGSRYGGWSGVRSSPKPVSQDDDMAVSTSPAGEKSGLVV